MSQGSPGPIGARDRILTLDAMRGFALLGICMVNMQFFALPFMDALRPSQAQLAPAAESLARGLVSTLCEYKFISLFSLMFGMGLVLQMHRAQAAARPFVGTYVRRLLVLALLGLIHGFLLWYGDILFLYSVVGTILLLCRNWSAKVMLIVAGGLVAGMLFVQSASVGIAVLVGGGDWMQPSQAASGPTTQAGSITGSGTTLDESAFFEISPDSAHSIATQPGATTAPADEPVPTRKHGFRLVLENPDPSSDGWRAAEIRAYREGPLVDAFAFRAISYFIALAAAAVGYGWRVLAMFLLGAAFMKLNFFDPSRRTCHKWMCCAGLGLGLPMEAIHSVLSQQAEDAIGWMTLVSVWLHELGSLVMCLGYAGAVTLVVQSGRLGWLARAVACVGRTALTNYLAHTAIATSIMYWWGLGLFNEVSRPGQIVLVIAIYSTQLLISITWLKIFSIGPVEWLWRTLTYGRLQPVLRRHEAVSS